MTLATVPPPHPAELREPLACLAFRGRMPAGILAFGPFETRFAEQRFVVDVTGDGEEALQLALAIDYALLILDVRPPGRDDRAFHCHKSHHAMNAVSHWGLGKRLHATGPA